MHFGIAIDFTGRACGTLALNRLANPRTFTPHKCEPKKPAPPATNTRLCIVVSHVVARSASRSRQRWWALEGSIHALRAQGAKGLSA
jgi:hypothetical protein